MPDAAQWFGNDLATGPTGDIAVATSPIDTQQRVLRRLLTNPGDYLWNPGYGAGLSAMVGQPVNPARIAAIIRTQMLQEAGVARDPPPRVRVMSDNAGTVTANIVYTDALTNSVQTLNVPVA